MTAVEGLTDEQAHDIGVNAYVYFYPLVTMEFTRMQITNVSEPGHGLTGPMNTWVHVRQFPPADFRVVVRPNFDTLYSSAWLDLRNGPVVVSAPEDNDGRYFELPMYDMWTDAFSVPGQRTTGTKAGHWAVVPPGWSGTLPADVDRIDAPTPFIWIIGRTQTNGPDDYAYVNAFQDKLAITPLSEWPGPAAPLPPQPVDPDFDMVTEPLKQVNALSAAAFFDEAMRLLAIHPPHLTDSSLIMQLRRLGIVPGGTFAAIDPAVQAILADAPQAGLALMAESLPRMARVINGWQMNIDTMGDYGNSYVKRAIVTEIGLGANSAEDAVYPICMADAEGKPLSGENDYVIHFAADALPPVNAFWSVTMYDAEGFQVANELNRFAIGDRDPLQYNADGSLDLYLQHANPGPDKMANWLPAPNGPLGVTMRLYSPKPPVLHGTWNPPAVTVARRAG